MRFTLIGVSAVLLAAAVLYVTWRGRTLDDRRTKAQASATPGLRDVDTGTGANRSSSHPTEATGTDQPTHDEQESKGTKESGSDQALQDPPERKRWTNFTPHEKTFTREEEERIVSELTQTGTSTTWLGRLKFSDSPQVVQLLMTIGDRYNLPKEYDSTLTGCMTALCGIYERTRQGYIREYLLKKYSMWDRNARRLLILKYPFGEELVSQLRDALADPADRDLRQAAALRVWQDPAVWSQLQTDVYTRLAVETDKGARYALQKAKDAMETPR